jgi:hypothetical protein
VGADFWPVLKDKKGRKVGSIAARYPRSNWGWLNVGGKATGATSALMSPGDEGALATMHFELMREGLQECEGRIMLEHALALGQVKGALAERCRQVLDERTRAMHLALMRSHQCAGFKARYNGISWEYQLGLDWFLASGWQERSAELFTVAAQLAEQ